MKTKKCKECGKKITISKSGLCKSCVNKRRKGMHTKGGWHHSKEHKEYLSKKYTGRKMSKESVEKSKKAALKRWSNKKERDKQSIRIKLAIKLNGHSKGMLGKHHTQETKDKMTASRIGLFTGEKSGFWKGGITPINIKIRMSLEYKEWRENIFKRDNYTCQKTGIKGGKINAHHIENFADYPELRFVKSNGITLSKKMHYLFHKIYGKKNNTREQLNEFLIS